MKKLANIFPIFVAVGLTLILFWQFFIKGYVPAPASFMAAWYEPWKSDTAVNGVPTIPHKALGDDVFRQIVPLKFLATNIIRTGEWPLWNPFGGSGQPLLANLHPGYLNPFSALLFLEAATGWSWFVIVQLPLLFLVTYWYGKKLNLSTIAAIASSAILSLSGFVTARFIYGDYVYALIGLPLLLGLIEDMRIRKTNLLRFVLPFVVFYICVSVQPQISFYIFATGFLYALIRLEKKLWAMFLGLFFLGLGLAAVQLVPTFDLLRTANVTTGSSSFIFEKFLMPVSHLVTVLIPNYFGNPGTYNFWGKTDYVETIAAVGSIAVSLALIAVLAKKKSRTVEKFFGWGVLVTILLTFDWPLTRWLYSLPIPILSTNIPTRLYMLTTFFIAVLAGYGVEAIKMVDRKKLLKIIYSVGFVVGVFFVWAFIAKFNHVVCTAPAGIDCWKVAYRNSVIELGAFIAFALAVRFWPKITVWVAISLITILGVYNAWKIIPMSPREHFMVDHPLFSYLRTLPLTRVASVGDQAIATDLSSYYGFFDINYYDPLYIKRYGELVSYANTGDSVSGVSRSDVEVSRDVEQPQDKAFRRSRIYELLSVGAIVYPMGDTSKVGKQLWSDDHRAVVENQNVLPRAYFVSQQEVIPDKNSLLQRLFDPEFDPQNSVLLETSSAIAPEPAIGIKSRITVSEYTPNRVILSAELSHDGFVVLTDTYDEGWRVWVDGRETKIHRANYALRAVEVMGGNHELVFVYAPKSLIWGWYITIVSLILWLIGLVFMVQSLRGSVAKR